MKKIIKVLGIIIFSAFLLSPLKTYASEPVWKQGLDLNDSVSSSIVKVEDGVVVMQYEGVASASNLLIKYDFNGNKLWEIDNDYGYNIESVSDGFIVWSEEKITKFDKDKNILWSKDIEYKNENNDDQVGGLGNKLIELKDGYIIGQTASANEWGSNNDFIKIDVNGNVEKRLSQTTLLNEILGSEVSSEYKILALGKSQDGNSLIIVSGGWYNGGRYINIILLSSELTLKKNYENSLNDYSDEIYSLSSVWNYFNNIIETDEGYILAGRKTVTFTKEGKIEKKYNKIILDIKNINNCIYGYVIEKENEEYIKTENTYKTAIVKYDSSLKEIDRIDLDFYFNYEYDIIEGLSYNTGFSQIKNRIVYYESDNLMNFITLNTPINPIYRYKWTSDITKNVLSFDYSADVYELASYKFKVSESTNDNNNSGIINNIIKNPQTNSIVIISIFVLLILVISIVSYRIYKKKNRKTDK